MTLAARLLAFAQAVAADVKALNSGKADASSIVHGVAIGVSGVPTASARYPTIAPYGFTATSGNSTAKALVAATAATVFTIKKGTVAAPTTVGTFSFAAAGTVATVSITAGAIAAGDTVWIEAPAGADATLKDVVFKIMA